MWLSNAEPQTLVQTNNDNSDTRMHGLALCSFHENALLSA